MPVLKHIENPLALDSTAHYAAILGESPSKGAKSPDLWNAAFSGLDISGIMHPMDVKGEKLQSLVQALRDDPRYIGGAVTMPYKIDILPYLDILEPEAEAIGAVNCIYRDGAALVGANTDGAGALWSLEKAFDGDLEGRTILLLGTGGAAYAVAGYIAKAIGQEGTLRICGRSAKAAQGLAKRLSDNCAVETTDWPVTPDTAAGAHAVVNCTSIGFETLRQDDQGVYSLREFTPLATADDTLRIEPGENERKRFVATANKAIADNLAESLRVLASLDSPLVFDIVYQPIRTMLLALAELFGYTTLTGAPMNLEQAVIAFDIATSASGLRHADRNEIRQLMAPLW